MKKFISNLRTFLIIIVLLNFLFSSFSQDDYYPFPQTGAKWTVLHTKVGGDFWETREYKTADTITIENTLYRLLVYSCLENHYYAFREENKQIFFYIPDIGEVLMYDFNLNVGDTIFYDIALSGDFKIANSKCKHCDDFYSIRNEYVNYKHYQVVESIDKIVLADGSERKRFSLNCDIWIEGIGSIAKQGPLGPIALKFALCGDKYHFTCLRENENIIYLSPKCTDCLCGNTCEPVEDFAAEKCNNNCVLLSWSKHNSDLQVKKYTIFRNNEILSVTTDTTYMDENLPIGEYEYYVVTHYDNDCVSDSSNHVREKVEVGIEPITNYELQITLYPNPTTGELRITNRSHVSGKLSEANYELRVEKIEIFDIYGRKVLEPSLTVLWSYDLTVLQPGIYFVKIQTENGVVAKKLVKM